MIPEIVKKIDFSKLRIKRYGDWDYSEIPTKLLKELNITEYEPFQIIDKEKGEWDGKWGIVQEFWVRDWQTFYIIRESQLDYYFTNLFKCEKKKCEYYNLEQQSYFKELNLELTDQQLFYIKHALELGFKQMPQDDKETYDGILKLFKMMNKKCNFPKIVKKIELSKCRIPKYGDYPQVPTKLLNKLNITEDEPFQIVGGNSWDGKFGHVQEFWQRDWQTFTIITKEQAEFYFTNLFKDKKKKEEYDIMNKNYEFTPQLAFANIETHMKMWAELTNAKNFVVGISGGKDSTVVAMLLCAIFGKERVYGVMMPQGEQSDIQDSIDVCDILGIHQTTVNIGGSVSAITDEIYKNRSKSGIYPTKDMDINLPARIRMATLHAVGQCVNGRVINTSNLSEDMVGYATQFGDNAGAYAPLQGLTVTEVKELGKYLIDILGINGICEKNNRIIYKSITMTELIDKRPADGLQEQTDEQRLGFTYADLDKFIRLNEGSDEFKKMIRKKYNANKFKLEIVQMPQPDFSYLPNFVKD